MTFGSPRRASSSLWITQGTQIRRSARKSMLKDSFAAELKYGSDKEAPLLCRPGWPK
jgi:hypothetical protein